MIDISQPLHELCDRLELEPRLVARLTIHPRTVEALYYDDPKRLGEDGKPITVTLHFKVQT